MHRIVSVLADIVFNRVSEYEIVDITARQQAFDVGVGARSGAASVNVNLPADARILQGLKNGLRGNQSSVRRIVSSLIDITVRGACNHIFPVWRSAGHDWREPPVWGRECRPQSVVVIEVIAIVITHDAHTVSVEKRGE